MSRSADPERARLKAEEQAIRQREGAKVWAEHEAQAQAVDERTAKLKAQRLARDAAVSAPEADAPAPSKRRK